MSGKKVHAPINAAPSESVYKVMSPEDATFYVRTMRDNKRKSWSQITRGLKNLGYQSPRTGKALTESSVRNYYYYGPNPRNPTPKSEELTVRGKAEDKAQTALEAIRGTLEMQLPLEAKLKMIQTIVDNT